MKKIASELERQKRTNLRSIQFLTGRYWNLMVTGKTKCTDSTAGIEPRMIYHPNSEYQCDNEENEEYLCSDCGVTWLLRIPS